MNRTLIVKKLKAYSQNPDLIKEPSMAEMADLVVLVLSAVEKIEEAIKAGRLDGKTPQADKDYLSLETAQKALKAEVEKMLSQADQVLSETSTELEKRVAEAIKNLRNGKDGIVSDAEIKRAAEYAASLIEVPDFDGMLVNKVQGNGALFRDALESIPEGEEQLRIEAIQGLKDKLQELEQRVGSKIISGGMTRSNVLQLITDNAPFTTSQVTTLESIIQAYEQQPTVWYNGEINSVVTPVITADGDLTSATDQVPVRWYAVLNADDDVAAAQQLLDGGPNVIDITCGETAQKLCQDDDGIAQTITTIYAVCVSSSAVPADYTGGAYIISGSETDIADVLANMARFDFSSGLGATYARLVTTPVYNTNYSQLSVQVGVLV